MSGEQQTEPIIGIDLGTTNSLVAYCDERGPRILEGPAGERTLPSVVRLSPATGKPEAIGLDARRHAVEHPENTVFSAKRLMGRGVADLQGELNYLPYPVVPGAHDTARVQVGEHVVSPQAISAMILQELRSWAEAALGQPVRKAVITVPAYFDDAQRQATRDAGRIAGLEVLRIVNEPTAASLAYNLGIQRDKASTAGLAEKHADGSVSLSTKLNPEKCSTGEPGEGVSLSLMGGGEPKPAKASEHADATQTVAVFDLGGGTFDISILRLQHTEQGVVDQVLATDGNTHLGGDDVDRQIVENMQREIREQFFEGQAIQFPPGTRQAFRNFAEAMKIRLSDQDAAEVEIGIDDEHTYRRSLPREELEVWVGPWLDRACKCCQRAMKASKLTAKEIDRVILVGGSTRMPAVRRAVAELFETEPYTALNPDEVVALGAAVQGSILAGVNRDMLLLDVIPLSLGIETMGGAMAKLIVGNSTIPARATERFSTYAEGQTNVKINVLQGERELVKDCRSLGEFELRGIPPMPAGLPKIEVTFLVDANGILNVRAEEQRSGKRASIQIVPNHGLTREEVEQIELDSFAHAREDMLAHRLIDLRMNAKLDIRNIGKQLERVGDELAADERKVIEDHIAKTQAFIDAPDSEVDADAFHQAMTDMDHATIRLAELAIKQTLAAEQGEEG